MADQVLEDAAAVDAMHAAGQDVRFTPQLILDAPAVTVI